MDAADRHWLAPLERHQQRRRQGVPTVTVLVGPVGAAEWTWRQWFSVAESRLVNTRADQVVEAWLGEAAFSDRLADAIRRRLAQEERIPVDEMRSLISGRSPAQLEGLAAERAARLDLDVEWLRWALGLPKPKRFRSEARGRDVSTVAKLMGVLPPLLVRPPSPSDFPNLARFLFEIAEEVPAADVAVAVEEATFSQWRGHAPARLVSALTEGLIPLRPGRSGARSAVSHTIDDDEYIFARSRAERTLHDELESRARTRGLFVLNVELGAQPPLEVDLLCEQLKVAIEIDGYHHFRDATNYRRDRHKDVRLQELGYLVVRVLATDVENELAHVLERIDRVVAARRGGRK